MIEPPEQPLLRAASERWHTAVGVLPMVAYPLHAGGDEAALQASVRRCAARYLGRFGSILFRGFDVPDVAAFRRFAAALGPLRDGAHAGLLEAPLCAGALVPCRLVGSRGARTRAAALHSEHADAQRWPTQLWAWCERAPSSLAPSLADTREVYRRVPKRVRNQLIATGIVYERDLGDLPERWPHALRGLSRAQIEGCIGAQGGSVCWGARGALRIARRGRVVARHPRTGELVWFNHVHALPAASRDAAHAHAVRYADGSAIEPALVDEVRAAFLAASATIEWQAHDLLLVDNMLTAHALPEVGGRFALALSQASAGDPAPQRP